MKVVLSLGSNIGDRRKTIIKTISKLRERVKIEKVSSLYETEPWGYRKQNKFFNVVISGETNLNPKSLLFFIKKVEKEMGRRERFRWGPREIDVDIVFYEDVILKEKDLKIPHKDYRDRDFVIVPLLEIEDEFIDPERKRKVRDLFTVKTLGEVKKIEDFSFKRDVFSEFNLTLKKIPSNLFFFRPLPSTQKFLKKNFIENTLVVSSIQTEGRGRKGNLWISKRGGLWFSFTERPVKSIYALPLLSALSVGRALKEMGIHGVNIKIPNDVYIKDKKVCGIISEGIFKDKLIGEVIGVGLNVNLNEEDFKGTFLKPPTSIFLTIKILFLIFIGLGERRLSLSLWMNTIFLINHLKL
ncbi:MAG: 2-amino-4-hydroxy-6-hydroxymethyldihydropteridine diphosphokinase [Caldisericia bacterium]|nr:2-amino-4-hydroxy-6-hydroxymethyldihydropteridine diphosphokinase [Caldisericia bacterium]